MQAYFTTRNVRFNPPKDQHYVPQAESVPSDIDVVGLHPRLTGTDPVMVVSCKSWQTGFAASHILAQLRGEAKNPKRPRELQFRELWMPRWARGFREKIEAITGEHVVLRTVTATPAASEMGRLAQLLKAAGLTAPSPISQPSGPRQGTAAQAEELVHLG
jgi:hypothetical protein